MVADNGFTKDRSLEDLAEVCRRLRERFLVRDSGENRILKLVAELEKPLLADAVYARL